MEREYDVFEEFPDGYPVWRGHARGLEKANALLQEIAKHTTHECFAVHLPTHEVAARANVRGGKPVVFQVAYDNTLATQRTKLLRVYGYEAVTVFGNEAAKLVLSTPQKCDFFIVGHGAEESVRSEMVKWLKARYAQTPVLVMNARGAEPIASADFNIKLNGPETWLALIARAVDRRP